MNILWKGSPNFSPNSSRKPIDRIVLHWWGTTGSTQQSVFNEFNKPATQSSAHYSVSDKTIWQFVKEEDVAWHAGNWAMNQRSLGIEHDATEGKEATPDTLNTSIMLVADICKRYGIPADSEHIIPHKGVSATKCPGTLPIELIIKSVNEALNPVNPEETDEGRAMKALKAFKDNTDSLKNGNLEGAVAAGKAAYLRVLSLENQNQILSETATELTNTITGLNTTLGAMKSDREKIASILGTSDDSAVILGEVQRLVTQKDSATPSIDVLITWLISTIRNTIKKKEKR